MRQGLVAELQHIVELLKVCQEIRNKRYSVDSRLTRGERIMFDKFNCWVEGLVRCED